jgi:hypothetical protein
MSEHIVELNSRETTELAGWLLHGTGSHRVGRVTFESVEHGGVLVRTDPYPGPPKREPVIVEREARIVEVLRGGRMTVPGIACVLANKHEPSRTMIAMVTQSLITLEKDGIVERVPLISGRRHWTLA